MSGRALILAVISAAVLLAPVPLRAALVDFYVIMDADQVVGVPVDSEGTGAGWLRLDTSTNTIEWSIIYSNLTADPIAAELHGPAKPGEDAEPLIWLDHTTNPMFGSATINDSEETQLLGSLWYVSIDTQAYPSGEIRGQLSRVIPEPATVVLLALGGLFFSRGRRRLF